MRFMTRLPRRLGLWLVAFASATTINGGLYAQSHGGLLEANWIEAPLGTKAPNLQFTDQDGQTLGLVDFQGKAVVVNFWATWCGPCRAEMPTLQDLATRAFDGGEHLVLAVALERDFLAAKRFLASLGADDVELVLDTAMTGFRGLPDQGVGLEDVRGLPATLLISPTGELVGHVAGPANWDEPFAHNLLETAFDVQPGKDKGKDDNEKSSLNNSTDNSANNGVNNRATDG